MKSLELWATVIYANSISNSDKDGKCKKHFSDWKMKESLGIIIC